MIYKLSCIYIYIYNKDTINSSYINDFHNYSMRNFWTHLLIEIYEIVWFNQPQRCLQICHECQNRWHFGNLNFLKIRFYILYELTSSSISVVIIHVTIWYVILKNLKSINFYLFCSTKHDLYKHHFSIYEVQYVNNLYLKRVIHCIY